ncbi:MAG TPA: endonuclease/exonuclease/phosphatase family protein [Kofleriaceae bacterium]|nr:endonuclease/exonuclease/phosphatase family protein [Kofleriaceae bacterium]
MDRSPAAPARPFSIVDWNVYLGADILRLVDGVYPGPIAVRAAELWSMVAATDFARRAGFLAARLAELAPVAITLQEVFAWSARPAGGPAVEVDHLAILAHELARRGVGYRAFRTRGFTCEVPMAGGSLAMTDSLVTLVRDDVDVVGHTGRPYHAAHEVTIGGRTVRALRCWSVVELAAPWPRIVNTHLEFAPGTQPAQAAELLALVDGLPGPLVLAGDFNLDAAADPGGPGGASGSPELDLHGALRRRGFTDAWDPPRGRGATATQDEDLTHLDSRLSTRIDWVLARGAGAWSRVHLLGAAVDDRRALGLWPSDHAGITAVLASAPGGQPS